jgi:membrane protein implicated in regulation of membrane protease activity
MTSPSNLKPFWWVRQASSIALACFFIWFGIHLLIATYGLKDPFSFILAFFASNFIILISATLLIVFLLKVKRALRGRHSQDSAAKIPPQET